MGVGFQDSSALESQSLSRVSSVNVMITVLRFKEAAEACMPNPNDGQKHKAETQQVPYALRAPRPHSGLGSDTVLSTHRLHTHAYRPSRRRIRVAPGPTYLSLSGRPRGGRANAHDPHLYSY